MRLLYNVNIHLFTQYTKINEMTDYFLLIASWLNHLWVGEGDPGAPIIIRRMDYEFRKYDLPINNNSFPVSAYLCSVQTL